MVRSLPWPQYFTWYPEPCFHETVAAYVPSFSYLWKINLDFENSKMRHVLYGFAKTDRRMIVGDP